HPGDPADRTAGRERRGARSAAQLRRPRTIRRHRPDRGRRRHPLPGATDGRLEPLSRRTERKDDMTLTSSTLESAVTAAVSDLLFAIDDLDWEGVRNALADEVTIDYTSLWGGELEHLAASELVARWQGLLPGFDATQHLTGPIVVRQAGEGRVTATTTVRGYHVVETAKGADDLDGRRPLPADAGAGRRRRLEDQRRHTAGRLPRRRPRAPRRRQQPRRERIGRQGRLILARSGSGSSSGSAARWPGRPGAPRRRPPHPPSSGRS